jgi:hypothetical protein
MTAQLSSELRKCTTIYKTDQVQSPNSQSLFGVCRDKYLRNQSCLLPTIQATCGLQTVEALHYLRNRPTEVDMRFEVQQ